PWVPPTSAVSPQPTRPLSVLTLINRASRTSDRATDGPIALGSLCSTAKVSTFVMVSALGFFPAASAAPQRPATVPAAAPHEPASPALNPSRRVQPFCSMGCPFVHGRCRPIPARRFFSIDLRSTLRPLSEKTPRELPVAHRWPCPRGVGLGAPVD